MVLERLLGVVPSVNGDERRLAVLAKTAGVLPVHHGAAGEDHDVILLAHRDRQMFPMHKVAADSVAPAHVAPFVAKRVVLVEQVVFPVVVDQPVGSFIQFFAGVK